MSTQIILKIDKDIKENFDKLVRVEGKTRSAKIREFIEEYIEENDIEKYVDDLWKRIGNKLKKNYSSRDVSKLIKTVRDEKGRKI
ncbi:MAG: ribbon-helix-helix domain-containing protein [Candidatus Omnitrophica bacterium]|nr:ribbon-helix-helix domain-containing protein [Candidatus Omnitrophota bacterium]